MTENAPDTLSGALEGIKKRREQRKGYGLGFDPVDALSLLAAVEAVLKLHQPDPRLGREDQCEGCATHVTFTRWPCKTVEAITAALAAGGPDACP